MLAKVLNKLHAFPILASTCEGCYIFYADIIDRDLLPRIAFNPDGLCRIRIDLKS